MAKYLRDGRLSNVSIDEDLINQISEVFEVRREPLHVAAEKSGEEEKRPFMTFVLRFDNKGYRLFSVEELLQHFRRAKSVERLVVTIETTSSIKSNRLIGEHLELRLDSLDERNCILSVTADDSDWVDASYSAVLDVLKKAGTRAGWARSPWTALGVQLLGVVAGFLLSLWAAVTISDKLVIQNAFVITFLFAFLLFSNAWGFINNGILGLLHRLFPNVQFQREGKSRWMWLPQTLVGGSVLALVLFLLSQAFNFVGDFIASLLK